MISVDFPRENLPGKSRRVGTGAETLLFAAANDVARGISAHRVAELTKHIQHPGLPRARSTR